VRELEQGRRSPPVESHVAHSESALGVQIAVVQRLASWKSSTFLVFVNDEQCVLKLHGQRGIDELGAIRQACEWARKTGWPTPSWKGLGIASEDVVWALQEFVEGANLHVLTAAGARAVIAANERQSGLGKLFPLETVLVDRTTVIEDMMVHDHWRNLERLSSFSPAGLRLVEILRERVLPLPDLPSHDLVHGDYNQDNILLGSGRVTAFVDTDELGTGTRYFDLVDLFDHSYQNNNPPAGYGLLRKTVADGIGEGGFWACLATTAIGKMIWFMERMPDRLPYRIARLQRLLDEE
jgi:aminoglycoside phosphotransferase